MDIRELQARAVRVAALYDRAHRAAGRAPWDTGDLALGLAGDVGDLAKLVLAVDGRRDIPDARRKLGHELADCLWAVLVLADRYQVDIVTEFAAMTGEIETHLAATEQPGAGEGTQ